MAGAVHGPDLSVDQQLALRTAAAHLADDFAGVYGPETIERFLHSSYDQFATRSTVPNFLPLMAERFAGERLTALAKVDRLRNDGRPVVLFLCVHNAGRSQMALGFFQRLAGEQAVAWSGGSEPGYEVNPVAVAAMAEVGIDIGSEYPKPWTDEVVRAADVAITMGCGDACPIFPGKRYEDWDLADPAGLPLEEVRLIRGETERRVRTLLEELNIPAVARPVREGGQGPQREDARPRGGGADADVGGPVHRRRCTCGAGRHHREAWGAATTSHRTELFRPSTAAESPDLDGAGRSRAVEALHSMVVRAQTVVRACGEAVPVVDHHIGVHQGVRSSPWCSVVAIRSSQLRQVKALVTPALEQGEPSQGGTSKAPTSMASRVHLWRAIISRDGVAPIGLTWGYRGPHD